MPMFTACGSNKDKAWVAKHGPRKRTVVVLSQCPWYVISSLTSPSRDLYVILAAIILAEIKFILTEVECRVGGDAGRGSSRGRI